MGCEVENLPNGSRLRVRNKPGDETYHFGVSVKLSCSIGATTESFTEKFTGIVYDYGVEFTEALAKCWKNFSDVNQKYAKFKILLEPDLWKRLPAREREIAVTYLDVLSILYSNEELGSFEQALANLPAVIGTEFRNLITIALDDHFEVQSFKGVLHQPGPAVETMITAAEEGGDSSG